MYAQIMFLILIVCNIFDFMFTEMILTNGGTESNPLMSFALNKYGHWGFLLSKELIVAVLIYFLMSKRICNIVSENKTLMSMLSVTVGIYIAVIFYQIFLIYTISFNI